MYLIYLKHQAKRFLDQVVNSEIAFTGMGFFRITRRLVLAVSIYILLPNGVVERLY